VLRSESQRAAFRLPDRKEESVKRLLVIAAVAVLLASAGFGFWAYNAASGIPAAELESVYVTADDRFVDIGGARVRVREQGPANAPVLLMLHGFTYSLESWDALAAAFDDEYRVIRYDLLGHGLTGPDPQERYSPFGRAAFAGEVMDALGIEEAAIFGNSLGGLAAWRFAADHPERVSALVLISPGAYAMNGISEEAAPVPPAVEAYLRTVPEAGLEKSLSAIYADPAAVTPERRKAIRDMMRREGAGEAFVRSLELFTLPDPDAELARIEVPTLIIWGREDAVISPQMGERMAETMPNAELVFLDGVGHVAHEEDPGAVAALAGPFLKEAM
jgi:pimeloyl-ACP methyl ester carboxylesterase